MSHIYWLFDVKKSSGGLAQLVEHLLCKQGVVGSNPSFSTMGFVAQLVRAHA
jgi:hypothetical protein